MSVTAGEGQEAHTRAHAWTKATIPDIRVVRARPGRAEIQVLTRLAGGLHAFNDPDGIRCCESGLPRFARRAQEDDQVE